MARSISGKDAIAPGKEPEKPATPAMPPDAPAEKADLAPAGLGWWWVPVVAWLGGLLVLFAIDIVSFLIRLFNATAP